MVETEREGSQFSLLLLPAALLDQRSPLRGTGHPWTRVSPSGNTTKVAKIVAPPGSTPEEPRPVCVAPGGFPLPPRHLSQAQCPTPPRDTRMKHPLQPPSQEFMWTPSQDARACILDSVWEGSSPCPQVKFFFVRGPLDGNPLPQLNCISMLLLVQHPQE